ncbi:hypothetical protein [Mycobacterium colombiense]|uniref:hypothetical protein n=1 Tax=Mycobacterium colombiense TaxID=339268 RepID=UPI00096FC255|nr:hypothetical protein [Mycobacterium colombiense]OMB95995.1 hypothetical protein A5732_10310 [Mycobacterium colombiense]
MTDADGGAPEPFTMSINGPDMSFKREVDPAIIPTLMQLAFGGGDAGTPPPPPLWSPVTDPRVDLDTDEPKSPTKKAAKKAAKRAGAKKTNYDVPKGVNYAPSGKQALKEFAESKKPTNNQEKLLVVVYWLQKIAERDVTAGEVIAAFNFLGWRPPANPPNALQVIATRKQWFDTKDMNNVEVMWTGENYLQHDLPKPEK